MRILHVDTGREMRGGQWQVLLLMRALARRGHQQELLARADSPLLARAVECGLGARPLAGGWRLPPCDVVHAHDAAAHRFVALRAHPSPLVVSRRVAFPLRRGLLSRWKYARADRFIAVSQYVARELQFAGIPEERMDVIYDGVQLPPAGPADALRAEFRARWNIAPDAFVAGTLTSLREKPIEPLLETAERKPLLQLLVAAPDVPAGFRPAEKAAANVRFLRSGDDVSSFLFALDVFVYLSESEGLGSGALLAMAHGLPVIASDTGGLPEVVSDNETGLLVNNTAEEVGAALEKLFRARGEARAMGSRGRAFIERFATDDIMAERTEQSYLKTVQGPRSKVQSREQAGV